MIMHSKMSGFFSDMHDVYQKQSFLHAFFQEVV